MVNKVWLPNAHAHARSGVMNLKANEILIQEHTGNRLRRRGERTGSLQENELINLRNRKPIFF